jgi:hypothetical protein
LRHSTDGLSTARCELAHDPREVEAHASIAHHREHMKDDAPEAKASE